MALVGTEEEAEALVEDLETEIEASLQVRASSGLNLLMLLEEGKSAATFAL